MSKSSHVHDASIQNIPRDGVFFLPFADHWGLAWVGSLAWESCEVYSRVIRAIGVPGLALEVWGGGRVQAGL